ncbi:MAG: aldolase [Proteobacteria bacterium]|nr:aldolase [Pseudomonadota bacterium]
MIDLLQVTNDPALARQCDAIEGMRIFLDLETMGKAERQAGHNTFISTHQMQDVARVKSQLRRAQLMVRVNPLHGGTAAELDAVLAQGADLVMLPMFHHAAELAAFSGLVAGRVPIVALLETAQALACLDDWVGTPGLFEVFVGLNDLHLSLGCRFMFEPLAQGHVDRVAGAAHRQGLRFGFGGIARLDEGLLPGRDVLAEHLRLGSRAVILSRTFRGDDPAAALAPGVTALRAAEQALQLRSAQQVESDRLRIAQRIAQLAATLSTGAAVS